MAGNDDDKGLVAQQAAADVAQVIRGKSWLQRVVELAESTTRQPAAQGPQHRSTVQRRAS